MTSPPAAASCSAREPPRFITDACAALSRSVLQHVPQAIFTPEHLRHAKYNNESSDARSVFMHDIRCRLIDLGLDDIQVHRFSEQLLSLAARELLFLHTWLVTGSRAWIDGSIASAQRDFIERFPNCWLLPRHNIASHGRQPLLDPLRPLGGDAIIAPGERAVSTAQCDELQYRYGRLLHNMRRYRQLDDWRAKQVCKIMALLREVGSLSSSKRFKVLMNIIHGAEISLGDGKDGLSAELDLMSFGEELFRSHPTLKKAKRRRSGASRHRLAEEAVLSTDGNGVEREGGERGAGPIPYQHKKHSDDRRRHSSFSEAISSTELQDELRTLKVFERKIAEDQRSAAEYATWVMTARRDRAVDPLAPLSGPEGCMTNETDTEDAFTHCEKPLQREVMNSVDMTSVLEERVSAMMGGTLSSAAFQADMLRIERIVDAELQREGLSLHLPENNALFDNNEKGIPSAKDIEGHSPSERKEPLSLTWQVHAMCEELSCAIESRGAAYRRSQNYRQLQLQWLPGYPTFTDQLAALRAQHTAMLTRTARVTEKFSPFEIVLKKS